MKKQIKLLSMAVLLASAAYGAGLDQDERCAQLIRAAKEEAAKVAHKTKEERITGYSARVINCDLPSYTTRSDEQVSWPELAGRSVMELKKLVIKHRLVLFSIDDRTAELDAEVGILGKHVQQLGGELGEATRAAAEALALKDAANARLAQENAEKDARIAELLAQLEVQTKVNEANARSQVLIERLIFASKDGRSRVPSAAPVRRSAAELVASATPSLEMVQEASK